MEMKLAARSPIPPLSGRCKLEPKPDVIFFMTDGQFKNILTQLDKAESRHTQGGHQHHSPARLAKKQGRNQACPNCRRIWPTAPVALSPADHPARRLSKSNPSITNRRPRIPKPRAIPTPFGGHELHARPHVPTQSGWAWHAQRQPVGGVGMVLKVRMLVNVRASEYTGVLTARPRHGRALT